MVKLKDYGFSSEEELELAPNNFGSQGFPKPLKYRRLVFEKYGLSIEEPYFWVINFLRDDFGFYEFIKISDIFSGSLFSGFGSQQATKTGVVQDRASSFLATVGKMSKEIFQIIRELKIIDEKLGHYHASMGKDEKTGQINLEKRQESSEVVLKGYWVDLVDGGAKSPTSVYGMASQLGYGPLPDLFFKIHPLNKDDIEKAVNKEAGQFNEPVKMVLKRKLQAYLFWKESTLKELETRRRFTQKYLKQHYQVIQMYIDWVKPYLRQAKMLKMREGHMSNVDLVSGFDTTLIDIEFIAKGKKSGDYNSIVLMHFYYASQPQGKYNPQYNQTEIVHTGRLEIVWRAYNWTDSQLYSYRKMREDEDNELIGDVIGAMNEAMREYSEDFRKYLLEEGESFKDRPDENRQILLEKQILNMGEKYKDDVNRIKSENKGDTKRIVKALEEFYIKNSTNKKTIWSAPITEMISGFKEIVGSMFDIKSFFVNDVKNKGILEECPICHTQNAKGEKICSKCKYVFFKTEDEIFKDPNNKKSAEEKSLAAANVSYEKFKKAHRMVTW